MPNFHLVFADWRSRPGRTEEWRAGRRDNFPTEDLFKREYPETIDDVLLAAEELVFPQWAINQCLTEYEFPVKPIVGGKYKHRYLTMWDQGRKRDATVGITLDITIAPYVICEYHRLVSQPYNVIQSTIEEVHKRFKGITYVGDDNTSLAIVENLTIPATHFLMGSLKPRCIMALKVALEQGYLSFPKSLTQLTYELSGYMWDDDGLVQDSVLALANALFHAGPPIQMWERPQLKETESRTAPLHSGISGEARPKSRLAGLAGTTSGKRSMRFARDGQSRDIDYVR